ncbi:RNA recognition motif. (a.k.a. RRM RBD or RNP domain) [Babesia microti strain RI]|uniref:RNA recognition motif. (A.k.a. RRM RBD or RNP domain) n=1 Tax=Babesia microti (strain RI) TaxID=1133968 RepID=A0A1R4AAA4_BABMR|nr:RNA recognition motif. (a.k.a. RRM RBD or RNP domain) [Babesia microti strain RI]SJK85915.1 RNA recognition motif. (a.k.a. RRM RBD or RNP domain) [Babesia microti strain RI]|eukprot:XP_021338124.1 RNA recognition motif. (a.k.a. RRM RBD or RNP domain) [Babesia microti strain RI]
MRNTNACIYVANLPPDITEHELDDKFYKFGRIRQITIKQSRRRDDECYAYIEFDSSSSVDDAIKYRDGYKFGRYRIFVDILREKGGKSSRGPPMRTDYRVIVDNLPSSASWQDLKDHMRKAGPVGYSSVNRGKGYVEYETKKDMEWALENLDKSEFKNIYSKSIIRVHPGNNDGRSASESIYKDHKYRDSESDKGFRFRSRSRSSSSRSRASRSLSRGKKSDS